MKLALTLWNPLWEEKEENKRQAEKLVSKASKSGAEFVLFPEMTLTGYSMCVERIGDEKENSETLDFFKELSFLDARQKFPVLQDRRTDLYRKL